MATNTVKTITIKVNGQDALVDINEIKKALKETGDQVNKVEGTNLTNFRSQLDKLKEGFMSGELGVKGLVKGVLLMGKELMRVFVTNPILLAITVIVGAIVGLVAIFKTFTPIVDKVAQAFSKLVGTWNVIKAGIVGLVSGNKTLAETFNGLGTAIKDAANEAANIKRQEQDLEDQAITLATANEQARTEIQKLMLQSRNRSLTEVERIKLLDKAMDIEKQMNEQEKKFADDSERVTFAKMTNGKRMTNEELANLKKIGTAESEEIKDKYGITDEQWKLWNASLQKQQQVEQGSVAISEKAQNQKDALREKQKADADKALADKKKRDDDEMTSEQKKMDEEDKITQARKEAKIKALLEEAAAQEQMDAEDKKAIQDKKEARIKELLEYAATMEAMDAEDKKAADKKKEIEKNKQDALFQIAADGLNAIATLDQAITQGSINRQKQLLKDKKITQQEYDKNIAEIQIKAAKREKAFAVASIAMSTAQAILGIWKDFPKVDYGAMATIMSVAVGVLGAAQIAKVLATPIDGQTAGNTSVPPSISSPTTGTAPNTSFNFSPSVPTTNNENVIKTYVISKDVQTQQQLDRQIVSNGTI